MPLKSTLMMLGWADHIGGAFFGLLKGLIVVQILLILFAAYPNWKLDKAIRGSEIAPYFIDDVSILLHVLPGEIRLGGRSDRARGAVASPTLPSRRTLQARFPMRKTQADPEGSEPDSPPPAPEAETALRNSTHPSR